MIRATALPALVAATLLLAACQAAAPGTSSPTGTASPSGMPTQGPTDAPSQAPTPAPTDEPTDGAELPPFTCDLPIVETATVPVAQIVDVRVGEHAGFDRVVFEFTGGTPELTLSRATPPFRQPGSGFEFEVEGESVLQLIMRGGSKQTDEGTSSYDGPTDFDPDMPMLRDLVEGGDFERQAEWYLGLADEACVRLFLLDDGAPRVVIDVEH